MKKIDMFTHIWPQPFYKALCEHVGERTDITMRSKRACPPYYTEPPLRRALSYLCFVLVLPMQN